ncbi:MAG: PfaD family polyunsaturated fatty acid/polyketide biosynthesis protein [Myxococcales bacterium]|nr:PfaD family polyunsaturated fatty acid/polyketide biosynthesis protein [Myxococcales bacterium]
MKSLGTWGSPRPPAFVGEDIVEQAHHVRSPAFVVYDPNHARVGVASEGTMLRPDQVNGTPTFPLLAVLPPLYPEWLGDRSFCEVHDTRFPYVTGAMANGIATTALVINIARAEMLGFFGAAGLSLARVEAAIDELTRELGDDYPWGTDLIHSPDEPALENGLVDLYLRRGVRRVSASAFMRVTPSVVRYSASGLTLDPRGSVRRENHLFAKISRPEVAQAFLMPPPQEILGALVAAGSITTEEAALASRLPLAEDIICEADSGGHTDNRPLTALVPIITALRDRVVAEQGYSRPIRVGAAGGLGTPTAVAAAFALGAAFVLTGSVNQGAVESGLSEEGRGMLASAGLADVSMAAAADMFELGVKLQVLKRGTLFAPRANRLYELYQAHASIDAIPAEDRARIEKDIFRMSLDEVWEHTRAFWSAREPKELALAERDPKHKMALCFRWYLGLSSRWAINGQSERRADYQIWCGPAMGAFNDWVKGSFLEPAENRQAVQIARNLMEGAAVITRAQQLRSYGVPVPAAAFNFRPRPLS